MHRMVFAALIVLGFTAASARADTLPLILDTPGTYQPGTPFTFEIRTPGLVDFTAYTIELVFDTTVPNPDLTLSAAPDAGQYPFPSLSNFQTGITANPGSLSLTLTDSTAPPGALTVAGTNDLIAIITVTPGPSFTGPITISVNPDTLSFDINSEAIPTITVPDAITVEQGAAPPEAVPTPAAWLTLSLGGLVLAARRRVIQRRT